MDILSHALWTNLVFKELPMEQRSLAISFGVLPDLFSFVRILGRGFLKKVMSYKDSPLSTFPSFVFKIYNVTHSLIIFMGVFLVLSLLNLEFLALAFCGWGLHILLDVFTHNAKFFPTPILWPISKFHFSGIAWSNKYFMIFNYSVLAFLYFVYFL